jgi:hypothetical protein
MATVNGEIRGHDEECGVSSLEVAALSWVFTQHHPLGTSEFIRKAKDRGVRLDERMLRQLYKQRVLVPLVAVTSTRRTEPRALAQQPEPRSGGTLLTELRAARIGGRLMDPAVQPFQSRLHFTPPRPFMMGWWNGLIYSEHQLAIVPRLPDYLNKSRYSYRDKKLYPRLPEPDPFLRQWATWYHRIALMATALEARYLPVLDPDYVYLVNAQPDEYQAYRESFDPVAMSERLRYSPEQVRKDAEELLLFAHSIDPLGGPWDQLLRRAPRDSWKHFKGDALSVMGMRETAEILLRFYEDLVEHGAAPALPPLPMRAWHPLTERLSERRQTLDRDLMDAGLSPHYGVVLALEGDTEEIHAPGVLELLGPSNASELVRIMALGGVDKDPAPAGALAATPVVTRKDEDGQFWWVMRPPTRFMVAADPEGKFYAPDKIAGTRAKILDKIRANLRVKGVKAADAELEELVDLRTWDESCYEFAHFSDDELADAIDKVHHTRNGWSREELLGALAYWRRLKKDIKEVWERGKWDDQLKRPVDPWEYQVQKPKLAEALWPVLKAKIEAAQTDPNAPVPQIAQVIMDALLIAQRWQHKSFVLTAVE